MTMAKACAVSTWSLLEASTIHPEVERPTFRDLF